MTRPGSGYSRIAPSALSALFAASEHIRTSKVLSPTLVGLVFVRASQLNGCGFCLEMHVAEALAEGETHDRLHALPIWRESARFTPREKAALAWTEAVTRIADGVGDEEYAAARAHFSDAELVELTHAIGVINTWNRLNVAFGSAPEDGRKAARRPLARAGEGGPARPQSQTEDQP